MPDCTPATLLANAKCLTCLSEKELLAVIAYSLATRAGLSTSATTLLALINAAGYQDLSEKDTLRIQAYCLCEILG